MKKIYFVFLATAYLLAGCQAKSVHTEHDHEHHHEEETEHAHEEHNHEHDHEHGEDEHNHEHEEAGESHAAGVISSVCKPIASAFAFLNTISVCRRKK